MRNMQMPLGTVHNVFENRPVLWGRRVYCAAELQTFELLIFLLCFFMWCSVEARHCFVFANYSFWMCFKDGKCSAAQLVIGALVMQSFFPPVRWGLLDFMSATSPPPPLPSSPPPPPASSRWQCSHPDLNCQNLCQIECQNLCQIEC